MPLITILGLKKRFQVLNPIFCTIVFLHINTIKILVRHNLLYRSVIVPSKISDAKATDSESVGCG